MSERSERAEEKAAEAERVESAEKEAKDAEDKANADRAAELERERAADAENAERAAFDPAKVVPPVNGGFVSVNEARRRLSQPAPKEPDHSGAAKVVDERNAARVKESETRKEKRKRLKSGTLSGAWVSVGNSLVCVDRIVKIDLPTEGDENRSITFTLFSGEKVTASGDESAEIMEELSLVPVPASAPHKKTEGLVNESGRVVSARDEAAEKIPGRSETTPNHPHRANAVLTVGETDRDVTARAGLMPIAPALEVPAVAPVATSVPPGEGHEPAEGGADDAADGVKAAGGAEHKTSKPRGGGGKRGR